MPREYCDHPLCKQLMILKDEAALKDVPVVFGASGREERMSGFLLSLLSPVWRARLCGEFSQGNDRRVDLDEDEAEAVMTAVDLACGRARVMRRGLKDLIEVGSVADRYQIIEVRRAVEEKAVAQLKLETCGWLLMECEGSGLHEVAEACRRMALEKFEQLTMTEGFMGIGEDVLLSLLEDENLVCSTEEMLFEGVVRWMKGDGRNELRGEALLEAIRFPVMSQDYLMRSARDAVRGSKRLERLVLKALELKTLPAEGRALLQRLKPRIRWEEYGEGQRVARRLHFSHHVSSSMVSGEKWVCVGDVNGTISVWNNVTLELERKFTVPTAVLSLAAWEGWLMSVSGGRTIRVWDVAVGECVMRLEGHSNSVRALAVSNGTLLSGSLDKTVKVWRVSGDPWTWQCEQTLESGTDIVHSLAWWGDKGVSGCNSGAICVWDLSRGVCMQTLEGHTNVVCAMVAKGDHLISASMDKSVRQWSLNGGACLKVLTMYPEQSPMYIRCLTISGTQLVGGSQSTLHMRVHGEQCEVVVWDADTLAVVQQLREWPGKDLRALVAVGTEVWGAVGSEVAVWR